MLMIGQDYALCVPKQGVHSFLFFQSNFGLSKCQLNKFWLEHNLSPELYYFLVCAYIDTKN